MSIEHTRTVDAIKVPLGFARGSTARERLQHLKVIFAPLLGCDTITVFNQGEYYFITRDASQTMLFPLDHPRQGQPRYTWQARPDGVTLGTLVEGA